MRGGAAKIVTSAYGSPHIHQKTAWMADRHPARLAGGLCARAARQARCRGRSRFDNHERWRVDADGHDDGDWRNGRRDLGIGRLVALRRSGGLRRSNLCRCGSRAAHPCGDLRTGRMLSRGARTLPQRFPVRRRRVPDELRRFFRLRGHALLRSHEQLMRPDAQPRSALQHGRPLREQLCRWRLL